MNLDINGPRGRGRVIDAVISSAIMNDIKHPKERGRECTESARCPGGYRKNNPKVEASRKQLHLGQLRDLKMSSTPF